jgi:hypothetical protein
VIKVGDHVVYWSDGTYAGVVENLTPGMAYVKKNYQVIGIRLVELRACGHPSTQTENDDE